MNKNFIKKFALELEDKKVQIEKAKQIPGFKKAYDKLVETKELTTNMLKFFNISIESFLRYANLSEEKQKIMIEKLIDMFK